MANINGWGRGTWGQGAWDEGIPVEPTGQAVTSGLGSPAVVAQATVTLTGLAITSGLGNNVGYWITASRCSIDC